MTLVGILSALLRREANTTTDALSEQIEDSTKVWESLVIGYSRLLHVDGRIAITGCLMFFVIAVMMSSLRRGGWQVWLR